MNDDPTRERPIWEHPSRRNFLGIGSVALATAVTGMCANAQTAQSTRKAEHDRSASDPGPENKTLFSENPDSNTPPPTDHGDLVPIWYSFDLVKKRVEEGGWTHEVTQRELPSSKDIAGVTMRLSSGSYRELHWHTADEWAYVLYGTARVTVMNPDGTLFIGDVSAGNIWLFPAGFPHSLQGLEPDGTEFLLVFNEGGFSEDGTFLISQWMKHTPREVLAKNLGLDPSSADLLPKGSLYIFPGTVGGSLQDCISQAGAQAMTPANYIFQATSMTPTVSNQNGTAKVIDSRNFPASKKIAAAIVTVKPGGMREMHWHPLASEWQYYIAGKGRMTVFFPVDNARTMDFNANDVGFIPSNSPHYIENTGDTDLVSLEMFASSEFMDVSLSQWIKQLPTHIVTEHLNFSKEVIEKIPAGKRVIV